MNKTLKSKFLHIFRSKTSAETSKAHILSPSLTRVTIGGTLNLECVVREEPPNTIWWWLNGTKLDLEHHRGGVHIETLRLKQSSTSKLSVVDFTHADAGLYECRAEKNVAENINNPSQTSVSSSVSVTVIDPTKAPPPFSEELSEFSQAPEKLSLNLILSLLLPMLILI